MTYPCLKNVRLLTQLIAKELIVEDGCCPFKIVFDEDLYVVFDEDFYVHFMCIFALL